MIHRVWWSVWIPVAAFWLAAAGFAFNKGCIDSGVGVIAVGGFFAVVVMALAPSQLRVK